MAKPEKAGRPGSIRARSIRSTEMFSFGRRKENASDLDEQAREKAAKRQKKEFLRSVSVNAATEGAGAAAAKGKQGQGRRQEELQRSETCRRRRSVAGTLPAVARVELYSNVSLLLRFPTISVP